MFETAEMASERLGQELGLESVEVGMFPDRVDVRRVIRAARMSTVRIYTPVVDDDGEVTEQAYLMIQDPGVVYRGTAATKLALLVDPRDPGSEFLSGQALLDDLDALDEAPAWIVKQTRVLAERHAQGESLDQEFPVRCQYVRADGRRCFAWSLMAGGAKGLCKTHARRRGMTPWTAADRIRKARELLVEAAPDAASQLESLAMDAESEPVRLKATTELLDRVGVRGGTELSVDAHVETVDTTALVREKLAQLAERFNLPSADADADADADTPELENTVDAEVEEVSDDAPVPERA